MGGTRLKASDIEVPFVDKAKLATSKQPFMIASYDERDGSYEGKPRRESVFTIFLIAGAEAGYEQALTVQVTLARSKLGKIVQKRGPCGPVVLRKETKTKEGNKRTNPLYVFVPVDDPKVVKVADALVEKLSRAAMDTSADTASDDAGDDDTPF